MDILFVDDERDYLFLMETILESTEIGVHCAVGGEEAIKMVKERTFDLILTDFNMPKMNGLELIRRLREMAIYTPAVLLTSNLSPEVYAQAIQAEVNGIFVKETGLKGIAAIINQVTRDPGNLKISK